MSNRPPARLPIPYPFPASYSGGALAIPAKVGDDHLAGFEFWSAGNVGVTPPAGVQVPAGVAVPIVIPVQAGWYEAEAASFDAATTTVSGVTAWYGPLGLGGR
jgi:hypothetical protein